MADFAKILTDLRKSKVSDLHIFPGENCLTRTDGVMAPLKEVSFTEDEVKKVILGTSNQKARQVLGKFRQVSYHYDNPEGERYRFSVFFDRGKFGLAIRFVPEAPMKMKDLGLPEPIKKTISKTSGLVIVSSPAGHGKTTTIAGILEFINQHYEKNIITVENPVEYRFTDNRSSFLQRSIPLDVGNFFEGLNEAYRLDPDIVVTDSISYSDAFDQALFLCEAGCMVIAASDGGDCQKVLERLVFSRPIEEREVIKGKLCTHLSVLISQKLVPCVDIGRVPAFDIVVNSPQIRTIIKGDKYELIKTPQEGDKDMGMVTYEQSLKTLVKALKITPGTAAEFFGDDHQKASNFLKG